MIYEQSSIDLFLIDWEKQRISNVSNKTDTKNDGKLAQSNFTGSAWRSLLVANEFNEMFGLRYISVELAFIIFTVLMKGFKWELFAANTTYLTKEIGTLDLNYILKFFLTSMVLLILGAIFYCKKILFEFLTFEAVRLLTVIKFPTPLQNFTDLCSVANISLFIFDSFCHGYYVHGINPVGSSEGTIEDLKTAFKEKNLEIAEEEG